MANISPLSLAANLCPNLQPPLTSAGCIDVVCTQVLYVDPSAPTPQTYICTIPVSLSYPGADTNIYFVFVVTKELSVGSDILCAQPKFNPIREDETSYGGYIVPPTSYFKFVLSH